MKITFQINYHTQWGQSIQIEVTQVAASGEEKTVRVLMQYAQDGNWQGTFSPPKTFLSLSYKYVLCQDSGDLPELGLYRRINKEGIVHDEILVKDYWQSGNDISRIYETKPFTDVYLAGEIGKQKETKINKTTQLLQLNVTATLIPKDYVIAISGNQTLLGDWNTGKPLLMEYQGKGSWTAALDRSKFTYPIEYKYCLYNKKTDKIEVWEVGSDRKIKKRTKTETQPFTLINDRPFRYGHNWNGAGIAIPVFSLRTNNGFGTGEFNDLTLLAQWSKQIGMKMIQILPVNETVASHSWLDSYPYKAISVMALHPMYLNIESLGSFPNKKDEKTYLIQKNKLNNHESVDYIHMMKIKSSYYKYFYDLQKTDFLKSNDFKNFYTENEHWLVPYAVFSCLRDRYKTANFRLWKTHNLFVKEDIWAFADAGSPDYDDVAVHYYIQYHLHKQFTNAVDAIHRLGIALKGDIPIGISPDSVDAWTEPELFNLSGQAGAPPDDFAVSGQNWGFPTYKWDVMAQDDFAWWKNRLQKMSQYFDAYRIDHILGFFRIWEIPLHATQGLLGHFSPALPLSRQELHSRGLDLDDSRFLTPYIHSWYLGNVFGDATQDVINLYLEPIEWEVYKLKDEVNTQRKIENYFKQKYPEDKLTDKIIRVRDGLLSLATEVLFIRDSSSAQEAFHPRINLHYTYSYQALDNTQKEVINAIYTDYFYHRHNDFWRDKAMERLPKIVAATNMLVCGEDLGMVPNCVPGVLDTLGILSLEIQRMPKNPEKEYSHPSDYPYKSVCSTSTHDMSTIRGWWEEDRAKTQRFFNHILGNYGEAPYYCEPWVAKEIIEQHLYSHAMLTIFPYQDLIALDGELRWEKTNDERINVPSNPNHLWRYRMSHSLEDLLEEDSFNNFILEMIRRSGR